MATDSRTLRLPASASESPPGRHCLPTGAAGLRWEQQRDAFRFVRFAPHEKCTPTDRNNNLAPRWFVATATPEGMSLKRRQDAVAAASRWPWMAYRPSGQGSPLRGGWRRPDATFRNRQQIANTKARLDRGQGRSGVTRWLRFVEMNGSQTERAGISPPGWLAQAGYSIEQSRRSRRTRRGLIATKVAPTAA